MLKNEVLIDAKTDLHAGIGEHIGYELGAKFVKNYVDANGDATPHFIGKEILEKMLNQPNCVGLNIYKAINENNLQTYVLVGMRTDGSPILEYTAVNELGKININEGIVADRIPSEKGEKSGWFDISI